jgi:hypothetical protein
MRLNFIPDGKTKSMSVISHKLDQKEVAGGKGKADGANRADAKKLAAAGLVQQPTVSNVGTIIEAAPISKKELKKQAKKEQKKVVKATSKAGETDAKPTAENEE